MPWLLRFGGDNDEVTFPDVLAGASTFEINFDLTIKAAPLGYNSLLSNDNSSGGTARNHIFTRNNRAIEVACVIGGVRRAFETSAGIFTFNQRVLLNLKYDGANLTLRADGVVRGTVAATGVLNTTSGAGDRGFTRVGQNSSLGFPNIDLYSLEFIANGATVRNYSPDASQPGSSLVNTLGGNNGTLINFTVPDCWVFYGSADTIASTAAWSITPIQWQGSAAVSAPTFSSTAAWSVSPMQWQGAANATPPAFNSVTAWSISPLQWQAAAASTAPGAIASAVAWTVSPLQWQAAAQPAPVVQSSAAWSISPLNWQGTASATVPAFTASAAWSISPMQWQASATATAQGETASTVNWSISPMRWQGSAAATVPTFNAAAAWTISPMVWQVSASIAGAPVFAAKGATITERFGSHAIIERLQTARIYE
jgi:hypothetical protein